MDREVTINDPSSSSQSCRSRIVKISAGLVMLHTLYLKYIVWHDWITSTSGIAFGLLAAFVTVHFGELRKEETHG